MPFVHVRSHGFVQRSPMHHRNVVEDSVSSEHFFPNSRRLNALGRNTLSFSSMSMVCRRETLSRSHLFCSKCSQSGCELMRIKAGFAWSLAAGHPISRRLSWGTSDLHPSQDGSKAAVHAERLSRDPAVVGIEQKGDRPSNFFGFTQTSKGVHLS